MFYCQLEKKPPTFSTLRGNSCLSSQVGFGFPGGKSITDVLNFHFTLSFTSIWLISNIIPGIGIFWLWKISFFHGNFHSFFFFIIFNSVQSLSHVHLFATPWITARQASLSITNSRSSLRLTSIESVMHPLSSPSPPAPNPSQHQSLFQWVNSSHEVAKVLEFHL